MIVPSNDGGASSCLDMYCFQQGGCAHAATFGELAQTLEETWMLIEAALDAASGELGSDA